MIDMVMVKFNIFQIKKSIEYHVVPEIEQYLHRISKSVNQIFQTDPATSESLPESAPLGDRLRKLKVISISIFSSLERAP